MVIKTIHGCTCKDEWAFKPGGKKYKGCVMGGPDNALCPLTTDPNKVKASCRGSRASRPYCAVKEKKCGYYQYNESGIPEAGTDFCDWSYFSYGSETMRQQAVIPPHLVYPGLVIYLICFYLVIPYIFYKVNHLHLLTTWLPNPLLIATSLSWHWSRTPGLEIFNYISGAPSSSHVGDISVKYLKTAGILGLAFVASVVGFNNIQKGLIFALIMLIFTHAIGPPFITRICAFIYYNILARNNPHANDPNKISSKLKSYLMLTSAIGLLLSLLLIILEEKLLTFLGMYNLEKIFHINIWSHVMNLS